MKINYYIVIILLGVLFLAGGLYALSTILTATITKVTKNIETKDVSPTEFIMSSEEYLEYNNKKLEHSLMTQQAALIGIIICCMESLSIEGNSSEKVEKLNMEIQDAEHEIELILKHIEYLKKENN